jgi:hypothetical protein
MADTLRELIWGMVTLILLSMLVVEGIGMLDDSCRNNGHMLYVISC